MARNASWSLHGYRAASMFRSRAVLATIRSAREPAGGELPDPRRTRLRGILVPGIPEIHDPGNPCSAHEGEGDEMRGGVRAGGIDHVHGIAAHDAPAGRHRPWPPADPPVGNGQDRRVPTPHGEVTLHLDEGRAHYANVGGNLRLELGIDGVIGTAIEGQDGDAPAELPEIARVLQGPQHTAAAALRRIVKRDEERVSHRNR